MPVQLKPLDPTADRVRVLMLEGWSLAEIAELTGLKPTEVRAANARLRMRFKRATAAPTPEAPMHAFCETCGHLRALPFKGHKS